MVHRESRFFIPTKDSLPNFRAWVATIFGKTPNYDYIIVLSELVRITPQINFAQNQTGILPNVKYNIRRRDIHRTKGEKEKCQTEK